MMVFYMMSRVKNYFKNFLPCHTSGYLVVVLYHIFRLKDIKKFRLGRFSNIFIIIYIEIKRHIKKSYKKQNQIIGGIKK